MRTFEIFLQRNKVVSTDWQRLMWDIAEYESNFTVEVEFGTNSVEFYLYAQKDLSLLTTKLEGFILKPVDRKLTMVGIGTQHKRVGYKLSFKNILEQKEIEEIKKQRVINKVLVNFRKILSRSTL